ncbi:MAG: AAA family ATPase [Desulfuromonadales bacterium]|nr:AAA family ATPase [Desulfuromonadales bacterium]
MSKELIFAIQLTKPNLAKPFSGSAKKLKGVNTLQWRENTAEMGPVAAETIPDIIMIDDSPENGDLFTRIKSIKGHFPQTTLFVVSDNKDHHFIIAAMKAGASEFLVEPISEDALQNAIDEVRAKLANVGRIAHGRVYSFVSAKGGVGSTVLAVNTAAALAMGQKTAVALIDMSFQSGDASVLLDIVPQNSITDISTNINRLDVSFLHGVMTSHSTGINFLPAPLNPEDSEEIIGEHISSILNLAKKLYDHVILDCASMHVNNCSIEAFKKSDKVFVVTDMSVPSIRNTVRLCKLIRKLGISLEKIEIVINRFIKGGALSLAEVEKNFDKPVYWLIPNDFADIVSSINRGIPLVKLSHGAPFSKNVVEFIKKFQGLLDDQNFRGVKGTFGKNI